ncbi:hypothetical protein, unlikely [Trypanosoma brucei gambiense DAL972]|uniref:T. brucei spp.-specific protein n=1 Tax=Trypanosoma brucei gambiense (strain MHOM/CI/86/DAL972) TaxID=679716 RepID=C9ZWT9_TRYB9|nr:hypothetical protein, unlikely [Trypanosoma brucei gambiense DAL972]CBH13878.1 hypothetical protein, unlikely [Trypanosoma brucei gambiense DAL972]|eukprot:XP_011776154.1 hypothetical protein, unlikely [Trypanosoma brucei gambiense DAL972]
MEGKFHILWRFIVDILVCTKADKSEGRGKDVKRKKRKRRELIILLHAFLQLHDSVAGITSQIMLREWGAATTETVSCRHTFTHLVVTCVRAAVPSFLPFFSFLFFLPHWWSHSFLLFFLIYIYIYIYIYLFIYFFVFVFSSFYREQFHKQTSRVKFFFCGSTLPVSLRV